MSDTAGRLSGGKPLNCAEELACRMLIPTSTLGLFYIVHEHVFSKPGGTDYWLLMARIKRTRVCELWYLVLPETGRMV